MMEHMPETPESVIEFGTDDDDVERAPRRRFHFRGLAGDRRLVPLTAVLGAVALFGSLLSEWQVTSVDSQALSNEDEAGPQSFVTGVAELGGWGGGYLCGLFLLVGGTVIALFGPAAGQRYARLAALGTGGVLLAILAALGSYLGETSVAFPQWLAVNIDAEQVRVAHGRGLWCAVAGVALVLLAVYLSGRGGTAAAPAWSWPQTRETTESEEPPDAPLELTIGPARPFAASPDTRDKPGEGISE